MTITSRTRQMRTVQQSQHHARISNQRPCGRPSAARAAVTVPLAPDRYKIQFTASDATYRKLERARALLRHVIPNGDVGTIVDRALDTLLADIEKKKFAATEHPRHARRTAAGSRHIPAAVRREVWQRDGARCAFVGTGGRCAERNFLELHHVVPFATGGEATVENIQLRCRAHNAYESEQVFGPLHPARAAAGVPALLMTIVGIARRLGQASQRIASSVLWERPCAAAVAGPRRWWRNGRSGLRGSLGSATRRMVATRDPRDLYRARLSSRTAPPTPVDSSARRTGCCLTARSTAAA